MAVLRIGQIQACAEITTPMHNPEATARGRGEMYFSGRLDHRSTVRLAVGDTVIIHTGRRSEFSAKVTKTGNGGLSFVALITGNYQC